MRTRAGPSWRSPARVLSLLIRSRLGDVLMTIDATVTVGTIPATFTQGDQISTVQQTVLYFPVNNDVNVLVQYPSISDGTGCQSEFYYKADRTTPDTDPST